MEQEVDNAAGRVHAQVQAGLAAVKDQLDNTAKTLRNEVGATARVAREEVSAAVEAGAKRVRSSADESVERASALVHDARATVRDRPEKWLLIAMVTGFALGLCSQMFFGRQTRREAADSLR